MPNFAKAATPELLGTPVKVSENRGRLAVEIDGQPFIAAFAYDHYQNIPRNSLLLINALTGQTQQYWFPQKYAGNGDLFQILRADNDCIYTTIGYQFVEFNLQQHAWTFHAPIDGMAMSFTQAANGKIYFGTYPKVHCGNLIPPRARCVKSANWTRLKNIRFIWPPINPAGFTRALARRAAILLR